MKNILKKEYIHPVSSLLTCLFSIGIIPILFFRWGIIPASWFVIHSFVLILFVSPCIVILTTLRWITKYPAQITWITTCYGLTNICTSLYASIILLRIYSEDGVTTNILASMLVIPMIPISALVIYTGYIGLKHNN